MKVTQEFSLLDLAKANGGKITLKELKNMGLVDLIVLKRKLVKKV